MKTRITIFNIGYEIISYGGLFYLDYSLRYAGYSLQDPIKNIITSPE